MKSIRELGVIVLLGSVLLRPALAGDDDLIHVEVHEPATGGGKPLDLRVDEIVRDEQASTIRVTYVSGGSVASSMFVLRAVCAVTRARGATAFHSEAIADQPGRYRVTFPSPAEVPADVAADGNRLGRRGPDVITLEQCALVGA